MPAICIVLSNILRLLKESDWDSLEKKHSFLLYLWKSLFKWILQAVLRLACLVWERGTFIILVNLDFSKVSRRNGGVMGVFIKIMVIDTRCIFCTTDLSDRHVWSSSEVGLLSITMTLLGRCCYFKQDKYICYQTELGSIHLSAVKPIYWYWVMMKESAHYFGVPSTESRKWGLKKHKLPSGFQGKVFDSVGGRGFVGHVIRLWIFFWLVDGKVIWSQHQLSGSNQSGVYMLVGSMGISVLQNSSKDMVQTTIYSLWGGTKDPWLCLMAKLLLFSSSQGYGFSCGHVWMWELDCEEGWAPKNWCFWTVVLEKTLESPLDCEEIQPVHPKGD